MKKLACTLFALALLHGCSSSETAPETAALPHPDEAAAASPAPSTESGDALFATGEAPAESAAANSAAATTESKAADALLATPVDGATDTSASVADAASSAGAESLASPTPSEPSALPPASEPTPVPKVSLDHEVSATPVMPVAKADPRRFSTYEAYKEYQEKESARRELQQSYDDRALFPHEDGAWQIGLDYVHKAFPGYDFDPGVTTKKADTMGGVLSVAYFPLRSLSFGRLGVNLNYSIYWSKYEIKTSATVTDTNKVHSIDAYGGRLVYELDYFLGQLVVPWVFLGLDKVSVRPYNLATTTGNVTTVHAAYPKNTFNRQSYGGGMHLNLNRLESASASRGLASMGIRKTYLAYTFLTETNGASHLLGLRFEY